MEQRTISLIQASLEGLNPISQKVDELFYRRLLDTYPNVFRLFMMDIEPQDWRLLHLIRRILCHVWDAGSIASTVRDFAESSKVFRLIDTYYDALAHTLVWTLRRVLGDSFTIETERAWWSALWDRRQPAELDEPVSAWEQSAARPPRINFNNCGATRRVISN